MLASAIIALASIQLSGKLAIEANNLPLIQPTLFTEPVQFDADDPAILYNAEYPHQSLILATDKEKAHSEPQSGGGIYVFNLQGKILNKVKGLDRPNNIDVIHSFQIANEKSSIAVVTERLKTQLRIYKVTLQGSLIDLTGSTQVFQSENEQGEDRAPMGIACWQSKGKSYAIVSPKAGKATRHLEQLELKWNPVTKKIDAHSVNRLGSFSTKKETESMTVNQSSNHLYYSDELVGIRKISLTNPKSPELLIQNSQHTGDHEGLAIWNNVLVSTDQRKDESVYWFYSLATNQLVGGFKAPVDETDGIEICSKPLGKQFPNGIMVAMNSKGKNFAIFDLRKFPNPNPKTLAIPRYER